MLLFNLVESGDIQKELGVCIIRVEKSFFYPEEMCAVLEYYAVYGGNAVYSSNSRITAICCVMSQKSMDLIYLAAEA